MGSGVHEDFLSLVNGAVNPHKNRNCGPYFLRANDKPQHQRAGSIEVRRSALLSLPASGLLPQSLLDVGSNFTQTSLSVVGKRMYGIVVGRQSIHQVQVTRAH